MNFEQIPSGLIVFFLTQTGAVVWFFIRLYFKVESMSKKVTDLEIENKELKEQLKHLNDTLLLVKNNTDLLLLGRIKTGKAT